MKQVIKEENKYVPMVEKSPQSLSEQSSNVCGSIRERVSAVRNDSGQGMVCDAGFGN